MSRAKRCSMLAAAVLCLALYSAAAAQSISGSPVDPAAAPLLRLAHPLGSGQNKPLALGKAPARGRLFARLMQQFVAAARAGDLEAAQQIQSKLWEVTRRPRQPGHRRALLQAADPAACPALANSVLYDNQTQWVAAGGRPTTGTGSPLSTPPEGPLPSIRFFTLEPCAEWGCRTSYTLIRLADGSVVCRGPRNAPPPPPGVAPPVPPQTIGDFAYFKVYDYDLFWDTDGDNVLTRASFTNTLSNINELTSKRGAVGASSELKNEQNLRVVPNPTLGIRGDSEVSGKIGSGLEVSRAVGDNGVFNVKTDLPSLSASGSFGAVLPGSVVTDRDSGDSDDNVVFRANQPALFGYFGKRKQ